MCRFPFLPLVLVLALACVGWGPPAAWADDPGAGEDTVPVQEKPAPPPLVLGEITGERVNLRVGPRIDNQPVRQLERGEIVIVVEEVPGWVGVRVPAGFPAAVAMPYVEPVGRDGLRVLTAKLNLRSYVPEEGKPVPGIFRDHPALGQVLDLIDEEPAPPPPPPPAEGGKEPAARPVEARFGGRWAWVVAPEDIRAYVSERFVKRIASTPENLQRLAETRAKRRAAANQLAKARARAAAQVAALELMETVGKVQQDLYRLRQVGGTDKMPIVALANQLDAALAKSKDATAPVLRLARALREDLVKEIELRVARHDAELARALGRDAPIIPPLEPRAERVEKEGVLRYEPTPGWKEPGVYFLWIDDKPAYALRLTVGGDLPHPDFASNADGKPRHLEGALPGERLFGIPVLEVRHITKPK